MPADRYAFHIPDHKVEYGVEIEISDLNIDPQAQRTLNERRAQAIADNIVPAAIGSIIVSQREDGSLYIVDGQHRWRACALCGMRTIRAEIHFGLTQAQEAMLFLIRNRESHKPRPIDEYHVGITGGVPLFVDTDRVLEKHSLSLGSTSANTIGAIAGVLNITDRYGAAILDRTLSVAEAAWGRSPDTWDGGLLGGIGMFLGRWGDLVDDKELGRKMLAMGPAYRWRSNIVSMSAVSGFGSRGTGPRVFTAYRLVADAWNKGRKAENRIEA
ncbi:DUF6551 family protein [Streptomyces heilongjiangensis]|uniref:DUF6551 family protein n=1 Tax=Streptomyces heilongjiangensis TaxID=945052 RepID=A0ABW1B9J1_9ACTN